MPRRRPQYPQVRKEMMVWHTETTAPMIVCRTDPTPLTMVRRRSPRARKAPAICGMLLAAVAGLWVRERGVKGGAYARNDGTHVGLWDWVFWLWDIEVRDIRCWEVV
jgi:hypothetical protein